MMISTLMALGMLLQDDTPADVYERLKKQNLFSPKLEKPKPVRVEREKPKDDGPKEPPPPKTFPFDVAGIVLDNKDQVYEALLYDREYDEAEWVRAGGTWHAAVVGEITENRVEVTVAGEKQTFRLGDEFEMLVEGRQGGRSKPRDEEKPKPEEVAVKPADYAPKPATNKASGLLDKYRKAKGQE